MTMTNVRTGFILVSVLLVAALATLGFADQRKDDRDEGYAIGLWGDLPYSDVQATVGVPNLIADMNRHDLAFTAHDGDLKTGNGAPICDDSLYFAALDRFNSLNAPAVFTPGDNDWTDCDRPNNGGVNSLRQLDRSARSSSEPRFRSASTASSRKCRRRRSAAALAAHSCAAWRTAAGRCAR
jgi:hypothetical protein